MKLKNYLAAIGMASMLFSCNQKDVSTEKVEEMNKVNLKERIDIYAPTVIKADISHLTENQKIVIEKLIEASKLADEIFWMQTSPESIPLRDSLAALNTPEAKEALEFVKINYGPYDLNKDGERMIGHGPEDKPAQANFYPQDLSKEELEKYIAANPEQKEELYSLYTVVKRDGEKLKAIPYHKAYPQQIKIASLLDEAAQYADNPSLKKYLTLRAEALRTDQYLASDIQWVQIADNDIDVIIGPIESYEDGLLGYKTAYESVVVVRDREASAELDMFKKHINTLQKNLPYDEKYFTEVKGSSTVLNIVNVVYFAGDCQAGTKTIACNLPNAPEARAVGSKNTMYKNMMEAKFNKIVVPIANEILTPDYAKIVSGKAFTGFVTLHEISHSLGRDYVLGKDNFKVREALAEKYSAVEETKADILSMYNHKQLIDLGEYTPEYGRQAIATYIAGLYRSIRFGAEEAHGKANLIQLNFLTEAGALKINAEGKYEINEEIFFDKCAELAKLVLTIEAEGDAKGAEELFKKYAVMKPEIQNLIDKLHHIPRDLNTSYEM